jgi:magnesium-transporting ATPase (P-type)
MAAFLALMCANLALLFANRRLGASWRGVLGSDNPSLWWSVIGAGVLLGALMYWQAAAGFFGVAMIDAAQVTVALGAGVALLVVLQLIKRFRPVRK